MCRFTVTDERTQTDGQTDNYGKTFSSPGGGENLLINKVSYTVYTRYLINSLKRLAANTKLQLFVKAAKFCLGENTVLTC